jgi:hypothetical protein
MWGGVFVLWMMLQPFLQLHISVGHAKLHMQVRGWCHGNRQWSLLVIAVSSTGSIQATLDSCWAVSDCAEVGNMRVVAAYCGCGPRCVHSSSKVSSVGLL